MLPARREQALGLLFTAAMQVLLALLLLSIAPATVRRKVADMVMFSISSIDEKPAEQPEEKPAEKQQVRQPETLPPPAKLQPAPEPLPAPTPAPAPAEPAPEPPKPASPRATAPAPSGPVYGPPDLRPRAALADTPRVEGVGPNGEPLYAAAWVREPWPDELRGYLSTARGPGWGLIACRTVANYRVEDCVILDEYPNGSGIGRAAQAAAWQFLVRPPQKGGRALVGEWVRIRIDYELRRANAAS